MDNFWPIKIIKNRLLTKHRKLKDVTLKTEAKVNTSNTEIYFLL